MDEVQCWGLMVFCLMYGVQYRGRVSILTGTVEWLVFCVIYVVQCWVVILCGGYSAVVG